MVIQSAQYVAAAAVAAIGLICWPGRLGRQRLAALTGRFRRGTRWLPAQPGFPLVLASGFAVGVVLAGPGGGCAGAVAAAVGYRRRRSRRAGLWRIAAAADLADALGLMVGELRSGAHPAIAAAATDPGEPETRTALLTIAATARLGGDVPAALAGRADASPALGVELRRLAAAWSVADRNGVALADLLDTVRGDLESRVRFRRRVDAQLAGPRATAAVLAVLPVLGVLLGEATGARPWHVLSDTAAGQLLLVAGVGLTCGGLAWTDRITARAVTQ